MLKICVKTAKRGSEPGNDILILALMGGCAVRQILINIDSKASDLQIPLRKWRRGGLTGINTHAGI